MKPLRVLRGFGKPLIQRGFCTHMYTHLCIFWSVSQRVRGALYTDPKGFEGFTKPPMKGPLQSAKELYKAHKQNLPMRGLCEAYMGFMKHPSCIDVVIALCLYLYVEACL